MRPRITVLGGGAWGTAVATLLTDNGYQVTLWCHATDEPKMCNPLIHPVFDMREAVEGASWVFEAIPVQFLRAVAEQAQSFVRPEQVWVVLSKGIEQDTLMFPSEIIEDVLGKGLIKAVLSGPSFAHDLMRKKITVTALAASHITYAYELQKLVTTSYFKSHIISDMLGIQIGGALKNVITLGIGILDGAGYTDNTKAFLFTRGLEEMVQVAHALGGHAQTIYGLSGVGDLVLTAMGGLSKNLASGKLLGAGVPVARLTEHFGALPEGVNTVVSVHQLARKLNLVLPVCQGIYRIMFEKLTLIQLLDELMVV